MDAISYSYADKAHKRIKKFIENPDSTSGVLTVPKTIAAGETITIPTGRVAILPDLQVDGDLIVDGDLFIPTGSMTSQVVQKVTSTDNAVVRFDGVTGQVQNSGVFIDDSGNVGIGTSSIFSNGGKTLHLYNNLNDGTVNSNSTVYLESANRNSNILCKGVTAGFQGLDSSGNIVGMFRIDCVNKIATIHTDGPERMRIDSAGNVLITSPACLGYGTGAGGTVTQVTSKSTAVTLNKPTGQIVMNNAALAAGASVEFILNNTSIITYSIVTVNPVWSNSNYKTEIVLNTTGVVVIKVTNMSGGSLSDSLAVRFNVISGAVA